jgi:hypothetical protein
MLRREVGGKKVNVSLRMLGEELAGKDLAACSLLPSQPGCGCFTSEED